MIKNILLIALTFFKIFNYAQNFNITYGFPEVITNSGQTDPSNTPTVTGLQAGSFKAIGTSLNPNASGRFSFTNWPVGAQNADDNYGNYVATLSPTVYYEVNVMINQGYTLNLTSLTFDVRRSGTGVRTYCVRSSLDNFTNNLSINTGTSSNLSVIPSNIFFWNFDSISNSNDQHGSQILFNSSFSSLTNSLSLRFYAWNAESNGGSFSIDNVNFKGSLVDSITLTAIPSVKHKELNALKVFPNPCRQNILSIKNEESFSKIECLDMNGNIIYTQDFKTQIKDYELYTVAFPKGQYCLRIYQQNKIVHRVIYLNSN